MLHVCKGNAPVSAKEAYMGMNVCTCVSSTKYPVVSYLSVYVMRVSESDKKAPPEIYVCMGVCAREIMGECLSTSLSSTVTCVCMYVNTAERLRLHKAVILLFIMKYLVLTIVSYSHTTTPCTLSIRSPRIVPHKENHPLDTFNNSVPSSEG